MRFLHTADLHLGKSLNGFSLVEDQRHILRQIVQIAVREKADAIVVAGDLYDKASPSAEAVALLDGFLADAAAHGLSCMIVPGNHDSADRVAYAATLLSRQNIHIARPFAGKLQTVEFPDEFGVVRFWLLPFVKPVHVRASLVDRADEIGQDYTLAIEAALSTGALCREERNVCVAHQFVTAGGNSPERSDSELFVGGIDNVEASAFDAFDYVALGHIHRAQRIGRDEVRYAGSPLKYSFSEARFGKSVTIVTLAEKGSVSFDEVPLRPLRDLREIKGPLDELISPDVAGSQAKNDYLHVILTDEQPAIDALARIRRTYPNAMALDYDNRRTQAALSAKEGADETEQLDPVALFERFYLRQNGTELTDEQREIVRAALERAMGTAGADEDAPCDAKRKEAR